MYNSKYLSALLSFGYFPQELPLVFTTADFGTNAYAILADWKRRSVFKTEDVFYTKRGEKKKKLSSSYTFKINDTEYEALSKPKLGYERREVQITHPIPQMLLAHEISSNWRTISKWLSRQIFTLDRIEISDKYQRSIKEINFRIHMVKKSYIESSSDWLVKTDITRFYPSIYTHSISWAAYGKEKVKNDIKQYKGSLADRLDQLIRSCNRNQTIGIPIGPATSRIIAEILSSSIDCQFDEATKNVLPCRVDRLQDDWFVGTTSLNNAESILARISQVYREFGLEINGSKTSIDHILRSRKESWHAELSSFLFHKGGALRGNKLKSFLDLGLRLQSDNISQAVVNYILSVIEAKKFSSDDIANIESFLLTSAVLSPISMDKICRILVNIDHQTSKISRNRIRDRFTELAEKNWDNGNTYEVMWLIYAMRGLKIQFRSKEISERLEFHAGSVIPLIILDMKKNNLFANSIPKTHWENSISKERIQQDWIWLLAYEGIRKGWLNDTKGVMKSPFFDEMSKRNVQFYDPSKNVKTMQAARRLRLTIDKRDITESKALIRRLRSTQNFDFDNNFNDDFDREYS